MPDLDQDLALKRAWDYPASRQGQTELPLIYGDLAGGQGPLWAAVCLDTTAYVYALAGHPLRPLTVGNQVSLYDQAGSLLSADSYTLNLAHDFAGQGTIATATFSADQSQAEPLGVRAQGKADAAGNLLANPLEVVADILQSVGGFSADDLDQSAYARAWARAEAQGYRASGALTAATSAANLLTQIMGDFLGSWWLGADGRLKLALDLGPGSLNDGELGCSFQPAHLKDASATAKLENLCNRALATYCYNPLSGLFEAGLDGLDTQDLKSQGLYGLQARTLSLTWVRRAATARTICARLVSMLSSPRRIITCEEDALINLHLERGDAALLSLPWLGDELGRPLVNQIVRVLGIEPQLDRGTIRFTLLDTGYAKTTARLANGSVLALGADLAGGLRDRKEYQ